MSQDPKQDRSQVTTTSQTWRLAIFAPVLAAFTIVTAVAAAAAYRFGDGVIYLQDRTISELTFFEVTGGVAMGVVAAVFGLGAAAIGAVGALVAAIIGASFGLFGLVLGGIVLIGVVTGPVLLITIIAILIKRRYWPDVI